jgi:diguanylate cyclase
MFWNRTKSGSPGKPEASPPVISQPPVSVDRPLDVDAVIDALGAVLRAMGKHAFDTDEASAHDVTLLFERWAQHVTIGGRHPDETDETPQRRGRDLAGMRRFFAEHRRREQKYVSDAVGELRQLVWSFVRNVHRAIAEESEADAKAKHQISRLHAAAMGPSIEELKREALVVVTTLDDILRERARRQKEQMSELGERLRTLGRQLEDARRESELDPLTKVGNRRAFDERFARVAELSGICATPACVVMVDLDHFKSINDTHGHQVGDAVLSRVADALSRAFLRKSDFVARYGGEEFAIVIPEVTLQNSKRLTARLLEGVRGLVFDEIAAGLKVTASVGVAELAAGESAESWLQRADRALYEAKNAGRDRVVEAPPPQSSSGSVRVTAASDAPPAAPRPRAGASR